jgi:hypothetical protein
LSFIMFWTRLRIRGMAKPNRISQNLMSYTYGTSGIINGAVLWFTVMMDR